MVATGDGDEGQTVQVWVPEHGARLESRRKKSRNMEEQHHAASRAACARETNVVSYMGRLPMPWVARAGTLVETCELLLYGKKGWGGEGAERG